MRLHLPKGLLAALLAACFALPAGAEGETAATQYGWKDGAPATSTDGTTWTNITYGDGKILSSTDAPINLPSGDVKLTNFPSGEWGTNTNPGGISVTGTADSAWFSPTGSMRIYMTGENISKMSNIFLTGVHFVVGTFSTASETHTIASNLFLGAGTWGNDTQKVHNVSTLRANVDTVINGAVSLVDDSVQISTWADKDITFSNLVGTGKTLSIGSDNDGATDTLGSVINLNGQTTLGALSVGTQTNTSGILTAMGRAISVVIGEQGDATLGDVSLLSGSTLTNKGQLSISGTYTGGTISQIDGANLTLGDGAIVNLDSLDFARVITDTQTSTRGTYKKQYTLVNGGSFSIAENVSYQLGGVTATGSLTDAVYFADQENPYYNIVKGETVGYSTITAGATVDFIRVAGTLEVGSDVTHEIMLVGGALQGTGAAATYSGAITMTEDSSIKLNGNMTISESLTATQGKTLSVTMAEGATSGELNIGTGGAEPGLAKVGKLDGSTLQIGDGVTVNVSGRDGGNAQIAGDIVVNGGGTLKLTTRDTLGYEGGNYTGNITLEGSTTIVDGVSTPKVATLNLTATATQTLTTNLILKGNTFITGEAMNSYGGSITVTGTNNIIGNDVEARKLLSINVKNAGDSLQMTNITRSEDNYRAYSFTKKGAGVLTITGDVGASGKIIENATVEAGKMEVQGAFYGKLTQQGGETVLGGKSTITTMDCTGGSVEMKGASSSIATLTGSGTLKTSAGSADVTDASGFTGTLESTGGTLSAGCGTSLAAIKATGGSVSLSSSAASVSVAQIDVGTDGSVSVHGNSVDFKVSVADLVVGESGSRLVSNLDVTGSLSVQVGSNGQTGGLNMAYSGANGDFPSGTLTLGSASGTGLELNLSYLPVMMEGDSLTLFKGVSAVQYYGIISAGTGETEATAVALSDPAPIALTGNGIDASTVFSNVAPRDFTLKFENNIVSLVAQRNLPEPTTATLSLLALMGLAARRRRKA